jgi:hypothetical protein
MDLVTLRAQFVKLSGRNDLISGTVDNGANFYINAGQRFLDRKFRFPKDEGVYPYVLPIGGWHVVIPFCRAVKEVWTTNTESRIQLTKKTIQDFLATYNKPLVLTDNGCSLFYTPAILRSIPESDRATATTMSAIVGYMPTLVAAHYEYNGILIGPPTDEELHVEVYGLFYSPELVNNEDQSFWSAVHPEVLLYAALYELEIGYRNTQGANDWMSAINDHASGIDMDTVEEDIAESDQMEG